MPYVTETVPAEMALDYKGVKIYHTYKDDDYNQGERTFYFVLDEYDGEYESFDVRDLDVTNRLENEKPQIYKDLSGPYKTMTPEQRAEVDKTLDNWFGIIAEGTYERAGQYAVIIEILKAAIDKGDIK